MIDPNRGFLYHCMKGGIIGLLYSSNFFLGFYLGLRTKIEEIKKEQIK
jgi:hypothetical protein